MKSRLVSIILGTLIGVSALLIFQLTGAGVAAVSTPTPLPTATPSSTAAGEIEASLGISMTEEELINATKQLEKLRNVRMPAVRIVIPKIDLDSKVIEIGTTVQDDVLVWDTAPFDVGHYSHTANPGETGNIVMSGHISTTRAGSVFKRLPEVAVGDAVLLFTADGEEFLYQVVETKVVEPSEISVMNQTEDRTLTLITCVPDGVYSHRLVVTAKQV